MTRRANAAEGGDDITSATRLRLIDDSLGDRFSLRQGDRQGGVAVCLAGVDIGHRSAGQGRQQEESYGDLRRQVERSSEPGGEQGNPDQLVEGAGAPVRFPRSPGTASLRPCRPWPEPTGWMPPGGGISDTDRGSSSSMTRNASLERRIRGEQMQEKEERPSSRRQ